MSLLLRLLRLKMYFNRGYGHLVPLLSTVSAGGMLILVLRAFGVPDPILWTILCALVGGICIIWVGYIDVKKGVYKKELSMNNEHNPELMKAAGKQQ